jgi:hypothetical protein
MPGSKEEHMSMRATRIRTSVSRTWTSADVWTRRSGCRFTSLAGTTVDDVLRRIDSDQPMTVAELFQAAAVLGALVSSGRRDVLVARVRVAVRLEALGV